MTLILEFLTISFFVAIAQVGIHAYLGIHVLSRNIIFVDLALAQIFALGATVAYMLGYQPQSLSAYAYSLTFTIILCIIWSSRNQFGSDRWRTACFLNSNRSRHNRKLRTFST